MSIRDLYFEIADNSSNLNQRELIELVEANKEVLDQVPNNDDDLNRLISLLGHHAKRLADFDDGEKALIYINQVLKLIESRPRLSGADPILVPEYENALFGKGCILFDLKYFKKAEEIFNHLSAKFPDSTKYKAWLSASRAWRLSNIRNLLSYTVLVLVLALSLFKDELDGLLWPFLIVASIGIVVGLRLTIKIELNKRKKKTLPN